MGIIWKNILKKMDQETQLEEMNKIQDELKEELKNKFDEISKMHSLNVSLIKEA